MYRIEIKNGVDPYEYGELVKVFLPPSAFSLSQVQEGGLSAEDARDAEQDARGASLSGDAEKRIFIDGAGLDRNGVKRLLYRALKKECGISPPWGILTGVRPVKLMRELAERSGGLAAAEGILRGSYLLSAEKAKLLSDICAFQAELPAAPRKGIGLYVGIPFCPTRCLYCSFTSNQKGEDEIERYMEALFSEMEFAGRAMEREGLYPETIYFGGGTPTTLGAGQLERLLSHAERCFDFSRTAEMTVEAGRPDTIDEEKLSVLLRHGIGRISINPQTSNDGTLELIGRSHRWEDVERAFKAAGKPQAGPAAAHRDGGPAGHTARGGPSAEPARSGFIINSDIIAGLPGESPEDFRKTLRDVISLGPENVTVHTLAVKKASRLMEADDTYHYRHGAAVTAMLADAGQMLSEAGYRPYYLYRQKHMAGALENVGYCKENTPCLYNVRIMDERQSILALGAGGISKKYYPAENRLERVPNVSNYEVYIDRLEEMKERKKKNFFEEVTEKC